MQIISPNRLRIGTRGSDLALWQANAVRDALSALPGLAQIPIEIVTIRTSGDRIQDRALLEAGGKGLFTKEIEEGLLDGTIDIAVHSAKDLQTRLPATLVIAAYLPRADVRDALVGPGLTSLDEIPEGASIGTASLRRQALVARSRPDLRPVLLRGNVPTRIQKVLQGECAATLLAKAGLDRLDLSDHIAAILPVESFPPACGQGAIALQCRSDNQAVMAVLDRINHVDTARAVACERAFLDVLDGSCRAPIAGHAIVEDGAIKFSGLVLSPDGTRAYSAQIDGDAADPEGLGRNAGRQIRAAAPASFLSAIGMPP